VLLHMLLDALLFISCFGVLLGLVQVSQDLREVHIAIKEVLCNGKEKAA
jgi:hypothetical protein